MSEQVSRFHRNGPAVLLGVLAVGSLLAWAVYQAAWLADDAYISYRVVDNWVQGHGLRWNVAERVQVFPHPLWLLVNAAAYAVTREMFFTGIMVGLAISFAAVALTVFRAAQTGANALLVLILLVLSRAFIEFSTSGLENPLSHLLLALFVIEYFRPQWRGHNLLLLALLGGLCLLTRMETFLLVLPALVYAWLSQRSLRTTGIMALGFAPFVAWELFSLLYYGFLFPNTFYAKWSAGLAGEDLFRQGMFYLHNSLDADPVTLLTVVAAIALAVRMRSGRVAMLAIGLLLYLAEVVRTGGDFMGGRLLTPAFYLAVLILCRIPVPRFGGACAVLLAACGLLTVAQGALPFYTPADFGRDVSGYTDAHGVGDERLFYFTSSSLRHSRGKEMPSHGWAQSGREYRKANKPMVKVNGTVGFRGFLAGPAVHLVDYHAMCDPLLARLPASYRPSWRIDHLPRRVPEGYVETLERGENRLQDAKLAEYYEHLQRVTRAPLFDFERLRDIAQMNLGAYDDLIDRDSFRFPPLRPVQPKEVAGAKEAGSAWDAAGNLLLEPPDKGFDLRLDAREHARKLELSLKGSDPYQVLFLRGGEIVASDAIGPAVPAQPGLAVYTIDIPVEAWWEGYDRLCLLLAGRGPRSSLGHVRFLKETKPEGD